MLTKVPSEYPDSEKEEGKALSHYAPNEAADQDHAEVESGVGSCL